MKFYLYSATQNTFFFITEEELKSSQLPQKLQSLSNAEKAQALCQHYGTRGADGFVIVRALKNKECDFEWEFYNRDGSSAEMCGNASRCMAFFVKTKLQFQKPAVIFNSIAGPILVKYLDDRCYSVRMPEHTLTILNQSFEGPSGMTMNYSFINTGVPHVVIEVSNLNREFLLPFVKEFRHKKEFGPAGANVSFVKVNSNNTYEGITFERGVEDFTASCGTGVVAMALSIFNRRDFNQKKEIDINTPGGTLKVELDVSEKFCWLTGSAELIEVVEGWM